MNEQIYIVSMENGLMKGYFRHDGGQHQFEARARNGESINVGDVLRTIHDFMDGNHSTGVSSPKKMIEELNFNNEWKHRLSGIDLSDLEKMLNTGDLFELPEPTMDDVFPPLDYVANMTDEQSDELYEKYSKDGFEELDFPEYAELLETASVNPKKALINLLHFLFDVGLFDDEAS